MTAKTVITLEQKSLDALIEYSFKKEDTKILFIGTDGEKVVDSKTTEKQIIEVETTLICELEHDDRKLTWDDFDSDEPRTLFKAILADRKKRVDEHTLMADRPSCAVITAMNGKAVRLEYYEGHDALSLVYDVRSKELQGKNLPAFLESDPQAYDPAKLLKEARRILRRGTRGEKGYKLLQRML